MCKIDQLKELVKSRLSDEKSGHDWYHTLRVHKNACYISEHELMDTNKDIIEISSLLHDIADHKFGYSDEDRVEIIRDIFEQLQLDMNIFEQVVHIVNNISFSKKDSKPLTVEGKIVQDADRLDAIGYIGIARTFTYGGNKGRAMYLPSKPESEEDTISHFYEKLLLVGKTMNTETAKKLANKRSKLIEEFVSGFIAEWNSEDIT